MKQLSTWTSQVVQWLGLCTSTGEGTGLIPGQGTKIPHGTWQKSLPQWLSLECDSTAKHPAACIPGEGNLLALVITEVK